jgi:hypothetical protein
MYNFLSLSKGMSRQGRIFFLQAPKKINANSLFCILKAFAIYLGDEIKARVRDVEDIWQKEEYIQIFGRET